MKLWYRGVRLVAVLALALPFLVQRVPTLAQTGFTDTAFQRTWERTDKPVADGRANRSWYWGPTPGFSVQEPYRNAPGGQRKVQYFDKTRMEINNPAGDRNSPFYVTNGLLATELMTGRMQVGDNDFETRCAADIPLASDNDDASAPTYATFGTLMNAPKSNQVGQRALTVTDKAGNLSADAGKAGVAGVELVYFEPITQRNIPKVFWEFLNASGPIYVNGAYSTGQLNNPWFFASGLPTTEAYWAKVKIGGQQLDVLIQGYERRVLTYIPAYNGTPFNVQMGNVGQHYYDWRYKGVGCAGPPPATQRPGTTPMPTQPPVSCGQGVPDPRNATIEPNCGPVGTIFDITIDGFTPNEAISFWITAPWGQVIGTPRPINVGSHSGSLRDEFDSGFEFEDLPESTVLGIWAITYEGAQSKNQAVVWFKIIARAAVPTATPFPPGYNTPTPPACDTGATHNATVSPSSGPAGTRFEITFFGFQPGEQASYWLTDPDEAVFGSPVTITMDETGRFNGRLNSDGLYPGRWALTIHGLSSNTEGIGVFCITP